MIRRLVALLAAGLVLGGLAAAPAAADPPFVKTNEKDLTFDVEGPSCEGTYFAGTVTVHEVINIQVLDNGRFYDRFQLHQNGAADLAYYEWDGVTPPDTSTAEPVYSGIGRYTSNYTDRLPAAGGDPILVSSTFPFKVNLDNGQVLKGNFVFHVTVNANGDTTTVVDRGTCDLKR